VRIAGKIPPHDGAGFLGHLPRECLIDPDESFLDELLNLRIARRTRAFIVSHGMIPL
jgi:hypothetical protein